MYRQLAPIYGENSAPIRWEKTLFPFIKSLGFDKGDNEPCVFYHKERDLTVLVCVDGTLADGYEEDIQWFFDKIADRFECKEDQWLTPETPIDFLGIDVSMDDNGVYMSMCNYIDKCLVGLAALGLTNLSASTPMNTEISDLTPLHEPLKKLFMTAVGCSGWLANTVRLGVALAHSRISQHMANPCVGALEALKRTWQYLQQHKQLCLHQPFDSSNNWGFWCDSDHAGNPLESNNRKSQNGVLAMVGSAPTMWGSKVTSIAFAHPDIGEAHPDRSSGAAEVYAAANATCDIMHLSYCVREMGNVYFPKPFRLLMDNTTAEAFANNSCFKSKLKHIDVSQRWVRCLRDHNIMTPVHVNTHDNLADIFTKVLDKPTFTKLRNMMLSTLPNSLV